MPSLAAAPARPLLRGYLHLGGAIVAPFSVLALLLVADSPRGYIGAAIFGASLVLLYSVSASYHLVRWRPRVRAAVGRLDHSMIFVFIAGTYTPFCLGVMGAPWSVAMLALAWGLAAAGVALKLLWVGAPRWLGVGAYLAAGWAALAAVPELAAWLPAQALVLMALGGLLYSIGGVIYAVRWPNPFPRVFGHHEVFHALVVAGSAVFYSVVAIYVLP